MATANNNPMGQRPVGGKVVEGNAKGAPQSTSKMQEGNDLRSGKGKDNFPKK